ncbi:DUF2079 domain-containing protein [Aromatoleum toluclasticum]|uniref:DUF2079 domain-containing protein n=1 Tax=Aromatoleum toluclasticum TaxID=92003 RepID=UPI0012F78D45|nr:DUF2079 domain-containing protein [Aromatoleum toluclasticum]
MGSSDSVTPGTRAPATESPLARDARWSMAVAAAIATHFVVTLSVGLTRHWGLLTSINDLGAFDQAIWGILNGAPFINTPIYPDSGRINWLGHHFTPILFLFAPLYALAPAAEWLIGAQALALSLAAWPLFLLARLVSGSSKTAFLWALAYLANPFLTSASVWDFHPVTLAVPMIVLSLYAIETKQKKLMLGMCMLLLLVQEQMGLTVAGFGILWGIRNKTWWFAALITLLGIATASAVIGILMPALSPTGNHPMLASELGQLSRYDWLGHSALDVVETVVRNPIRIMQVVFGVFEGWIYVFVLFLLAFFLPFAAPEFLLPAFPDLAINLLSANPMPRSIFAYHTITIVPVLAIAAIHGSMRLRQLVKRYTPTEIAGAVALASIVGGYCVFPLPLPGMADYWAPRRFATERPSDVVKIMKIIGDKAAVSVQANAGPHFTMRPAIYKFPDRNLDTDFIILNLQAPTKRITPDDLTSIGTLSFHLQMNTSEYLDMVSNLLSHGRHEVIYWNNSWLVLKRTTQQAFPQNDIIVEHITALRKNWGSGRIDESPPIEALDVLTRSP